MRRCAFSSPIAPPCPIPRSHTDPPTWKEVSCRRKHLWEFIVPVTLLFGKPHQRVGSQFRLVLQHEMHVLGHVQCQASGNPSWMDAIRDQSLKVSSVRSSDFQPRLQTYLVTIVDHDVIIQPYLRRLRTLIRARSRTILSHQHACSPASKDILTFSTAHPHSSPSRSSYPHPSATTE